MLTEGQKDIITPRKKRVFFLLSLAHHGQVVPLITGARRDPKESKRGGWGDRTWDGGGVEVEKQLFLDEVSRPERRSSRPPRRAGLRSGIKLRPGMGCGRARQQWRGRAVG